MTEVMASKTIFIVWIEADNVSSSCFLIPYRHAARSVRHSSGLAIMPWRFGVKAKYVSSEG